MNIHSKNLLIIFLVCFVSSCSWWGPSKLEEALKLAGDNRREMEKVLSHFAKEGEDSEKYRAAVFLLGNMKDDYSIEGERYRRYADTILTNYHLSDEVHTVHNKLYPLKDLPLGTKKINDIYTISAEYLINNIDLAFDSWQKVAWGKSVSFSVFCEYVLPYRFNNEPIENWRDLILTDSSLNRLFLSVIDETDIYKSGYQVIKEYSEPYKNMLFKFGRRSANIPDMPFSVLKKLKTGTCTNVAPNIGFVLRAMGIPVSQDFTPHWSNYPNGHSWLSIVDQSGSKPFNFPMKVDSLGKYRPKIFYPTKIYRKTFSINKESHVMLRGECSFLPDFLNDPRIMDVTGSYLNTSDIEIPIIPEIPNSEFAYLAVAERDSWSIVGWGESTGKVVDFKNIGEGSVYLPIIATEAGAAGINYPFILSKDGDLEYLKPNKKNLINMELTRKFRPHKRWISSINSMKGGQFQGSNDASFKNAATFHTITQPNAFFNEIELVSTEKFRYVRYLGRDSSECKIAELEFYYKSNLLGGELMGSKESFDFVKKEFAVDGDLLTSFETTMDELNPHIGLDLGEACQISKIRYSSINDQNHIVIGDKYELFYWDHTWVSLGVQVAKENYLIYEKAPSNALYFLKNHTEGVEERIFTYSNEQQVWY